MSESKAPVDDNSHRIEVVDGSNRADDEFFYGPDVGQAVLRGGFLYTKYGEVFPYSAFVRMRPCPIDGVDENYADWSEEYRRAVREAYVTEDQKKEDREAACRKRRDTLVELDSGLKLVYKCVSSENEQASQATPSAAFK